MPYSRSLSLSLAGCLSEYNLKHIWTNEPMNHFNVVNVSSIVFEVLVLNATVTCSIATKQQNAVVGEMHNVKRNTGITQKFIIIIVLLWQLQQP